MDALVDAAAAADAADADADVVQDPANGLPSEDELGPLEDELDDDAEADDDEDEADAADEAAPAADVDAPPAAAAAADLPTPPVLPADIGTLKVDELKDHLAWLGQPVPRVLKAELQALLRAAIDDPNVKQLTPQQMYAKRTGTAAAGRPPAAAAAPQLQWEPLDTTKVDRPVFTGSDKFVPNPSLGLKQSTHPFIYMSHFYPKSMRDLEVVNSGKYRAYCKLHGTEVYKHLPDITARTNSLAHAALLTQGANPVPDQRTMWQQSFFFKSHRTADMLKREEWMVRAASLCTRAAPHAGSLDSCRTL